MWQLRQAGGAELQEQVRALKRGSPYTLSLGFRKNSKGTEVESCEFASCKRELQPEAWGFEFGAEAGSGGWLGLLCGAVVRVMHVTPRPELDR